MKGQFTSIFSNIEDKFLIENYNNNGALFCATKLHKTKGQISSRIKYLKDRDGINFKISKELHIKLQLEACKPKQLSDYKVNPNQFFSITQKEIAYLLGLLWADGCVHINKDNNAYVIILNLVKSDFDEIIEIFTKTGQWRIRDVKKEKGKPQKEARTNNKPIALFLEMKNYRSKNKSPDSIIEIIPENLKHYFYRGVFDGDGCAHLSRNNKLINISGPIDQDWNYIEILFKKLNIKYYRINRLKSSSGNRSQISIGRFEDIITFGEYIYKNYPIDKIGLTRKYNKFLEIKKLSYNTNKRKVRNNIKPPGQDVTYICA